MSFSTVHDVLHCLAGVLRERLAGSAAEGWLVRAEVEGVLPPAEVPGDDVPRVVLQAGAGSFAVSGSLHRCFRFDCEWVVVVPPDGGVVGAVDVLPVVGLVEGVLRGVLAEWQGQPLVDVADGVAGVCCVAAWMGAGDVVVQDGVFVFRGQFSLVLQF